MKKWDIYTPDGVSDILPERCYAKRIMENSLRRMFISSGYFEIETPIIEFFDVFSSGNKFIPQESMFKFCDEKGRLLVLRPDMTIPVARFAATKLKEKSWPYRCSYVGNTFSYNEMGGGKQKEYTQAGIELLGVSSPKADAEVIAMAIKSLKVLGINDFQIDLGQVEFFKGIMEQSGLNEDEVEEVRRLIDSKDFVGVEQLVKSHPIEEELKELILSFPRFFGTADIIENLEKARINNRARNALENLKSVIEILTGWGLDEYVSIDLGMVQSLGYYTGIVFRGYTYGVGFPILSGGRYDNLVGFFGEKCPATGFSLGVNLVMMALERQKKEMPLPCVEYLVSYTDGAESKAFKLCEELRDAGMIVEMDLKKRTLKERIKFAYEKGIKKLVEINAKGEKRIIDLEKGGEMNI